MKKHTNIEPGLLGLVLLVAALSLAALTVRVAPAHAATFTVNTADDVNDGACNASHCSLREASSRRTASRTPTRSTSTSRARLRTRSGSRYRGRGNFSSR